jgi:hypothetical protein
MARNGNEWHTASAQPPRNPLAAIEQAITIDLGARTFFWQNRERISPLAGFVRRRWWAVLAPWVCFLPSGEGHV